MHTDFRPLHHLGTGTIAEVVLARHLPSERLSALKILRVRSSSTRSRILQEGRFQRKLRHTNLVPVLDVFELEDGTPVLEMPFIDGPDLALLGQHHRFTIAQADQMGRAILRGVSAIHDTYLVHRDLKPDNILIGRDAQGLVPMITDFGLAKLISDSLGTTGTRTGVVMGTPGYMAPEQFRDAKRADARSDVFALGTILYELLCGQRCFSSRGVLDSHKAALEEDYEAIWDLVPRAPMRMRRAIERALMPDPEDRPRDASALLACWIDSAREPASPWQCEDLDAITNLSRHTKHPDLLPETLSRFAPSPDSPPTSASPTLIPDIPALVHWAWDRLRTQVPRLHPSLHRQ